MKKKKIELSRKLVLNKESIMRLSTKEQELVNGGGTTRSLNCPPPVLALTRDTTRCYGNTVFSLGQDCELPTPTVDEIYL